MTPAFIRRAFLALFATLGLCAIAVWIYVPDPVTAARTIEDRMGRENTTVAEGQRVAIHPESTPAEKLAALRYIRRRSLIVGDEPRNPEVVAAMVELFAASPHPDTRADILRQLRGVSAPALLPTLLDALKSDSSHRVREVAAVTLEEYLGTPGVRAALIEARTHDANPRVKGLAGLVLDNDPHQ